MRNFRQILVKIAIFLLALFVFTALIVSPYYNHEVYAFQDGFVRDALAGSLDTLVCGASHAYYGIDPRTMDEVLNCSSYNISTDMMTMHGRYELLKKEIERNPVDLVFLELSYNSLTRNRNEEGAEGDIYQLGRYTNLAERFSYFFRYMGLDEYFFVYYDTLRCGLVARQQLRDGHGAKGTSEKYETKGYLPTAVNAQQAVDPSQHHATKIATQMDPECLAYLEKITDLCEEKGIQVVVVGVPITQASTLRYDGLDVIYNDIHDFCLARDLPWFDFNLYKEKTALFPDDTAYHDPTHLADGSAQEFTALMCQVYQDWQDGQDVADRFYTSYAQAEAMTLADETA